MNNIEDNENLIFNEANYALPEEIIKDEIIEEPNVPDYEAQYIKPISKIDDNHYQIIKTMLELNKIKISKDQSVGIFKTITNKISIRGKISAQGILKFKNKLNNTFNTAKEKIITDTTTIKNEINEKIDTKKSNINKSIHNKATALRNIPHNMLQKLIIGLNNIDEKYLDTFKTSYNNNEIIEPIIEDQKNIINEIMVVEPTIENNNIIDNKEEYISKAAYEAQNIKEDIKVDNNRSMLDVRYNNLVDEFKINNGNINEQVNISDEINLSNYKL